MTPDPDQTDDAAHRPERDDVPADAGPSRPAPDDEPTVARPAPGGPPPDDGADRAVGAEPDVPPRGLLRSRTDRVLFGVCGGIAERYGIEPLLIRIAFVVAVFFGGSGVLFYLAAAILIPDGAAPSGTDGPAPTASPAGGAVRLLVGIAAVLALLFGLAVLGACSFAATALLGGWPAAGLLVLLGLALIATAGSRRASAALLLAAVALAVPATAAVVADVRIDRSIGERTVRPFDLEQAAEGGRLGIGELTLDLRELDPRAGSRTRIPARVDVGQLNVLLPEDRCVRWSVDARTTVAGESVVLDRSTAASHRGPWGGSLERHVEIDPGGRRRPVVRLDLRVGVGEIRVGHRREDLRGWAAGVRRRDVDEVVRTDACRSERRR